MLRGQVVGLRAREDSDVPILHAELYNDVAIRAQSDTRPWTPIPADSPDSPFRVKDDRKNAVFSILRLADDELAGGALLWDIDLHNRSAHIGISLRPDFRGQGLGTDAVRVLCHYGFAVRGLHRLQIETLASNAAMIASATRVGFRREGTLRRSGWLDGAFEDEAVFGLLVEEWQAT